MDDKFPINVLLLGDKAYHCLPQPMAPYRDNGQREGPFGLFEEILSQGTIFQRVFDSDPNSRVS